MYLGELRALRVQQYATYMRNVQFHSTLYQIPYFVLLTVFCVNTIEVILSCQ